MLEAHDIRFRFNQSSPVILDGVSIAIPADQIQGLSGSSGKGKSTLGRILAQHLRPVGGRVLLEGAAIQAGGFHPVQYLSQSPVFTVNPRWRIGRIVSEAWQPDAVTRAAMGVNPAWYDRYPHELSGGELQRVAILRALAPGLRYLIADEISAMLDAITQVEIWTALIQLVRRRGIGILAISHDQALLKTVSTLPPMAL